MAKVILDILLIQVMLMCMVTVKVEAQTGRLPDDEVEALKEIATQVGKKDWNFSIDPCSNDTNWATPKSADWPLYNNTVNCDCTYPGGVCHVTEIFLMGQDLVGVLPPSLAKLPYLKKIDLTRNYLDGTIPLEWASTKLEYLSVVVNRLSGPIPSYLGNITTLVYMNLENNLFSGTVPPELGKLVNLQNLILSANNLTGELPPALKNLTNLAELRISSNSFTGRIPDFFQSWKQLRQLEIQGSGLEGPIPSSISALNNLFELRISDLHGEGSKFPLLKNMEGMRKLMMRSCNISGPIPSYISELPVLKDLDLSFNRLEGDVPYLDGLSYLGNLYLTSNLLNGSIPDWIKSKNAQDQTDLSYNYFSASSVPTCRENLNLFKSSSGGNNLELGECLADFPCSKDRYSLHINCGGGSVTIGEINYEADEDPGGAAKYVPVRESWELSSTGNVWDSNNILNDYMAQNVSILGMTNFELYTRARTSPLSVTYYGRCLANGNYSVKLHFAEIVIRNNRSFHSLGRRIFNVYVQGELLLKDFDIENEARGVDSAVIREFKAVHVRNKTLEIRFYWAGKGTTAAPKRGIYGPLVSAISMEAELKPPDDSKRKIFIVAGVVLLSVAGFAAAIIVLMCALRRKLLPIKLIIFCKKKTANDQIEAFIKSYGTLTLKRYSYSDIKKITKSFTDKLGQGGYGGVYKGKLSDGRLVAVKILSELKGNGEDFINEVASISRTSHVNVVTLVGFCNERTKRALIYEFMPNGSLDKFIYDKESSHTCRSLQWETLYQIAVGIAQGLEYLHRGCNTRIVHFDIKPHNILLDEDFHPKISDFGLAKLCKREESIVSMLGARGTAGYIAPEVFCRNFGGVSHKSDVYSYGMMVLEMVGGRKNINVGVSASSEIYFPHWIYKQLEPGKDLTLHGDVTEEEEETARKMIIVSLWCIQINPSDRPSMTKVVKMLEGSLQSLQIPPMPILSSPRKSLQHSSPTSSSSP